MRWITWRETSARPYEKDMGELSKSLRKVEKEKAELEVRLTPSKMTGPKRLTPNMATRPKPCFSGSPHRLTPSMATCPKFSVVHQKGSLPIWSPDQR